MSSTAKRLEALQQIILREMKNTFQSVPYELSAFAGLFVGDPSDKTGLKKSKKTGNLYYSVPNQTDKLRRLYGNLLRSITPRQKGNYSKVDYKSGHFLIEYGYIPSTQVRAGTRTTTLEYVAMNEATDRGKSTSIARPFLEPGFSEYFNDPSGWESLRQNLEDLIVKELEKIF
jgi:hypothetical protein